MIRRAYTRSTFVVMLAPLCWAGNFVLAKHLQNEVTTIQLNFWRWLLAFLILTPFVIKDIGPLWRDMVRNVPILSAQAITGIAVYHCLVYFALKSTSAINATLINSLVPMLIPVFSYIAFRQHLVWKHWLAIVLSTLGVALVVTHGDFDRVSHFHVVAGDLLMVVAAMTWAIYTLLLSQKPPTISGIRFLWCLSFIGTLLMMPVLVVDLVMHGSFPNTFPNWLSVGYVAVFAAVIAFLAWNYGATKFPAPHLGMFAHLIPVFGSLLAIAFLGETFRWFHAVGMSLIGISLWIVFTQTTMDSPSVTLKTLHGR
ncbi:hypothetical protein WS99_07375 [Burkholderia territorii]|nr:hypothetical protein WS99_07375 [Burkholderia territorii]